MAWCPFFAWYSISGNPNKNLGWKSREIVKHYLASYAETRRRAVDAVLAEK